MSWTLLPHWSTRVIAAVAGGLILLALVRWFREKRGGAALVLRIVILIALIGVMLNPQALLPRERSGKPKLIVLLDTSASMATTDVAQQTRLSAALSRLEKALPRLEREFAVDVRRFDRTSAAGDLARLHSETPAGEVSDIGSALMSSVSELGEAKSQAGVLLVSDGRATTPDTMSAAQLALARSVPIWTWTVGGRVPKHDLWVETASSEVLAFSGADVELNAGLHAAGYPNRSFKVELLLDGRVIETKEVIPAAAGVARFSMRVKAPEAGEQRYTLRVPAQPEESDIANNERAVFLRSVGSRVRVLVAEGQPHWDTKFLVQTLKRNPNVEVTAVYRLNSTRHVALVSSTGSETRVEQDLFPRTAEAMNAFDVIILGRGVDAFFDAHSESLLTDFVSQHSGSVVFARGKPYGGRFQPLAKLEPVAWGTGAATSLRLRPTEAGRENPMFDPGSAGSLEDLLERLPVLDQASVTLGEKPLAVVLANSGQPDGPVLVAYQRYGQGKAISLNAGGLWRWAFRETGQEESEKAYERFWISLLQWLMGGSQFLPGADVSFTSARRYYTSEQPMQFLVSTRNLDRTIYQPRLIIRGGGKSFEIEPRARGGLYSAEAGPFAPGTYQVTLRNNVGQPAELSHSVEVLNASLEKKELSADPGLMGRLSEMSGGRALEPDDVNRLPEIVARWEASRQLAYRQQPLWDRWWMMAGVFGLLGAEWWLRRREGLL